MSGLCRLFNGSSSALETESARVDGLILANSVRKEENGVVEERGCLTLAGWNLL